MQTGSDRRDKRSSQQSVFLSRLPHLASETPQAAYSPGSNPFAPRPDTRTPPGAAAAMKKSALPRAGSPAITTSADGAYYDIELTPGVDSKGPTRVYTNPTATLDPDADSWLSSPEVDLDGIRHSWDSVSQLGIPQEYVSRPRGGAVGSQREPAANLGTPTGGKGDSSKARAWLREHAKSPGRSPLASAEENEATETWRIPAAAATASDQGTPAPGRPGVSPRARGSTPMRDALSASPAVVPSPASQYPRSFPVLADDMSGTAGGSGSLRSWLKSVESEESPEVSPTRSSSEEAAAESVQPLPLLAEPEKEEAESAPAALAVTPGLAVSSPSGQAFASPISLADSPGRPASTALPSTPSATVPKAAPAAAAAEAPAPSARPAPQRPAYAAAASTALCLLAFVAAVAAAACLMPAGFTLAGPAAAGAATARSIFPLGNIFLAPATPPPPPRLLDDWLPAWLQPAMPNPPQLSKRPARQPAVQPLPSPTAAVLPVQGPPPAARAPTSTAPAGQAAPPPNSFAARMAATVRWPPPPPLSWSKPTPPTNAGTEHLKHSSVARLFAQPSTAAPSAPAGTGSPGAAQPAATPAPAATQAAPPTPTAHPSPAQPATQAPSLAASGQQRLEAWAVSLQQWAEQSELVQQVRQVLAAAPFGAALAQASPLVGAVVGAATLAAATCGTVVLAVARGSTSAAAAAGALASGEEAEPRVEGGTRPGFRSHSHSHMQVPRAPTTTPAVGGRVRARSSIAPIEVLGGDEGLPPVAPQQTAPRTATKSRARRSEAAGAAAPTPRTVGRSARRAGVGQVVEQELAGTPAGTAVRRSSRLAL